MLLTSLVVDVVVFDVVEGVHGGEWKGGNQVQLKKEEGRLGAIAQEQCRYSELLKIVMMS